MIDFPANPTVGQVFQNGNTIYKCMSVNPAVWSATVASTGIPEAPVDTNTYGRKQAAWDILTKNSVGLNLVDNTRDLDKPISNATASALAGKEPTIIANSVTTYYRGDKTWQTLNATAVGLPNVGNYAAVNRAGDTMSGGLTVQSGGITMNFGDFTNNAESPPRSGYIAIRRPAGGYESQVLFYRGGKSCWRIGDDSVKNFSITRWNDSNDAYMSTPMVVNYSSGIATFGNNIESQLIFSSVGNTECDLYGATSGGVGAWPNVNCGLIALRSVFSSSIGAGAISCYSGTGNTGVNLLNGATSWSAGSDERLKNIESEVTDGLAAVLVMRPIRYRYKTDAADARMRVGLSAQSVKIPEAISEVAHVGGDGTLYLHLAITDVIPHLVNAIQTLNAKIEALEAK